MHTLMQRWNMSIATFTTSIISTSMWQQILPENLTAIRTGTRRLCTHTHITRTCIIVTLTSDLTATEASTSIEKAPRRKDLTLESIPQLIMGSGMVQKGYIRSGELAGLSGISTDTLRHYERLKLLATPQRSSGNYRLYLPDAVDRVRLIQGALAAGFSLAELAQILRIRDAGGAPCRQVKLLLEQKLARMDDQIVDLVAMRDQLRTVLIDWDRRLTQTTDGGQAKLLETLLIPARRAKASKFKGVTI
jgi:DNA-binding transcriptional MerR regulator